MEAAEHGQFHQASPYGSSDYYPTDRGTSHLGVSDEDWNEAREELAHLGIQASPRDTYHHHQDLYQHGHEDHYYHQEPYPQTQFSPSSHLNHGFSSDVRLDQSPAGLDPAAEHYDHHLHQLAGSDSHSLYSPNLLNPNSHLSLSDEHHPSPQSHEFPLSGLSPLVHGHDEHGQQMPWNRQPAEVRFEEHHHPSPSSSTTIPNNMSYPLSSASDYTEFPYDDHDHHPHILSDLDLLSGPSELETAFQDGPFGRPLEELDHHSLDHYHHHHPYQPSPRHARLSPDDYESPLFSGTNGIDRLDDLGSHSHCPSYSSHQQAPLHDHYDRTKPQGYSNRDDELYESFNYRRDPEESLGHRHHDGQGHGVSPREDIERIRAQLDESLTQDMQHTPLSRSWDEPAMSVPDHRSPHLRAFESHPSAGLRPTLERPLSRSGLPYPTMSADEKTGLHSASSRPGLGYPDVSDLRSPYLSGGGRRSPHLGHTAWLSSSSASATRSPLMTGHHGHHQSVGTGAALHHQQDSLRDQLHQIHDLDNHIRESELAHQREQARVDRTAAELARLSLANDLRRSEEVNRERDAHQQRELARADRSAAELARLSVANDLRRAEEVNRDTQRALAHQHASSQLSHQSLAKDLELALADQRVASSQLSQQSLAQDLERRNAMAAHQRDLAALAHGQRVSSQLGRQQSMLQAAVRENDMYRELDQLRHQLDVERAQIARQRERVDTQSQLDSIDRQLRALDRQREVDRNRQLANLTRFGNLPSVLRGSYQGRPLASPYLQQSRFLTAARRWSARDKAPRTHRLPLVFDHVDAYYRLISDHLPRQLPLFKDPYYHLDSYHPSTSHGGPRNALRPRLLAREMGNPFVDGIDYDYGYGKVGRLGMKLEQFAREQAHILDDLYLFELLIRLDESIDEVERERRWKARMRWEECLDSRARVEAWRRMTGEERRRLGLSEGSYWASSLFGIPLDGRFGYQHFDARAAARYDPALARRPHYPLSHRLASLFPMWNRGGLGLGRRLDNWLHRAPNPPSLPSLHPAHRFPLSRSNSLLHLPSSSSLSARLPRPSFSATGTGASNSSAAQPGKVGPAPPTPLSVAIPRTAGTANGSSRGAAAPALSSDATRVAGPLVGNSSGVKTGVQTAPMSRSQATHGSTNGVQKPTASMPGQVERPMAAAAGAAAAGASGPARRRGASPAGQSHATVVAFNPRVKAVPPEADNAPPPPPRPPSRTSKPPARSALKTPPPSSSALPAQKTPFDHPDLDDITLINTHRNRATPKPPDPPHPN